MRKAKYDLRKVICRNASCIGYSSNIAKPGYWITYRDAQTSDTRVARVLGRIAETDADGKNCAGFIAAIRLYDDCTHAGIMWIDPDDVTSCYEHPPAALLAWITGAEWVKSKDDIARIIAMSQHGTLSESYIANRDNADQAYNARPEYVAQFILKD